MSKFQWNRETSLQLIRMIKMRPAIWDLDCADYKNKDTRDAAALEVANAFGCDVEELRKKWHALVVQYRREKKFVQQSEQNKDSKTENIIWYGYHPMRFMDVRVALADKSKKQQQPKLKRKKTAGELEFVSKKPANSSNSRTFATVQFQHSNAKEDEDDEMMALEEYSLVDSFGDCCEEPLIGQEQREQEQEETTVTAIEIATLDEATANIYRSSNTELFTTKDNETVAITLLHDDVTASASADAALNTTTEEATEIATTAAPAVLQDNKRDDLKIFTEMVEHCLRKITNPRRLCILRHKIETLLFEAEIEELDENNAHEFITKVHP